MDPGFDPDLRSKRLNRGCLIVILSILGVMNQLAILPKEIAIVL